VDTATALLIADLIGVAVFAASGASAGVGKRLDIFGVVFLGGAVGLVGPGGPRALTGCCGRWCRWERLV
jgi:uncharacterized membrane protein YeiH